MSDDKAPNAPQVMALAMESLDGAITRYHDAWDVRDESRLSRQFAALCEAVLWVVIIDEEQEKVDGYKKARGRADVGTMRGLRHARHGLVHHIGTGQWSRRSGAFDPKAFSPAFATPGFNWLDARVFQQTPGGPQSGKQRALIQAYRTNLQGREVIETINTARSWLTEWFGRSASGSATSTAPHI